MPDVGTGLTRSEAHLLDALSQGADVAVNLFRALYDVESAQFLGDDWAWAKLWELATGDEPLVASDSGEPVPLPSPRGDGPEFGRTTLRLTAAGEDVLAGRADRVALRGIDRWLGGTHLEGKRVWRWDPAERRVVQPC